MQTHLRAYTTVVGHIPPAFSKGGVSLVTTKDDPIPKNVGNYYPFVLSQQQKNPYFSRMDDPDFVEAKNADTHVPKFCFFSLCKIVVVERKTAW